MDPTAREKRIHPRNAAKAVATYFPFTSSATHVCEATVLNSSSEGLYFESRHPLKKGQCICIRMTHVAADIRNAAAGRELKSMSVAQVRWCESKPDTLGSQYRVGAQYVWPG